MKIQSYIMKAIKKRVSSYLVLYCVLSFFIVSCTDEPVVEASDKGILITYKGEKKYAAKPTDFDSMLTCRDIQKHYVLGKYIENIYKAVSELTEDSIKNQRLFENVLNILDGKRSKQFVMPFSEVKADTLFVKMNYWKCDGRQTHIMQESYGGKNTMAIYAENYVIYQSYYEDCSCYQFRFFNKLSFAMTTW